MVGSGITRLIDAEMPARDTDARDTGTMSSPGLHHRLPPPPRRHRSLPEPTSPTTTTGPTPLVRVRRGWPRATSVRTPGTPAAEYLVAFARLYQLRGDADRPATSWRPRWCAGVGVQRDLATGTDSTDDRVGDRVPADIVQIRRVRTTATCRVHGHKPPPSGVDRRHVQHHRSDIARQPAPEPATPRIPIRHRRRRHPTPPSPSPRRSPSPEDPPTKINPGHASEVTSTLTVHGPDGRGQSPG